MLKARLKWCDFNSFLKGAGSVAERMLSGIISPHVLQTCFFLKCQFYILVLLVMVSSSSTVDRVPSVQYTWLYLSYKMGNTWHALRFVIFLLFVAKLPKHCDPNSSPDPERWLPLRERSYYRGKRKGKKRDAGRFVVLVCKFLSVWL